MNIEHITLGGNSTLRDSAGILPETIEILKDFQITNQVKTLPFPKTDFKIKITSVLEGAIFDVTKSGEIGVTNVCCFDGDHTHTMYNIVKKFHQDFGFGDPRLPVLDTWIYSIPVNPLAMSPVELSIAGEIEIYIYYSLFLAGK